MATLHYTCTVKMQTQKRTMINYIKLAIVYNHLSREDLVPKH